MTLNLLFVNISHSFFISFETNGQIGTKMDRNVVCEVLYNIFSFHTVPVKIISKLVQVMYVRSTTKNSPFYLYLEKNQLTWGIFVSDDWLKLQIQ